MLNAASLILDGVTRASPCFLTSNGMVRPFSLPVIIRMRMKGTSWQTQATLRVINEVRAAPRRFRSCFKITGEFQSASEKVTFKAGKSTHIWLYGWV